MLKVLKMVPGIAACMDVTVLWNSAHVTATVVCLAVEKVPVISRYSASMLGVTELPGFREDVEIDKVFDPDDVAKIRKHFEAVFALPIEQRQAYLDLVRGDWK